VNSRGGFTLKNPSLRPFQPAVFRMMALIEAAKAETRKLLGI
jgi:hypothetical protein